ncbi:MULTISPECIES: cytochrome P450 [unclassified Streptomyces]|uniref:cytochrome P450 n=1 Tax=unclassified Streptomyces TaxID=2593676 RepID=UPI002E28B1F2|nr:cytochrome P450 [Streptomyces sp. NBC_01439]
MTAPSVLSLLDPSALMDPHPIYREWNRQGPVIWDSEIEAWLITGYDESFRVFRDIENFCQDWRRIDVETPASLLSLQTLDPPEHTQIRQLMHEGFKAVSPYALEDALRSGLEELLAAVEHRPGFDFVSELAEPLTLRVISALLGIPQPDPAWFVPLSNTIVDGMDFSLRPECYEPGVAARAELSALVGRWLESPPADGFVSHVAHSGKREGIEHDVLLNSLRVVLQAGFQTANRFLATGLLTLLRIPAERRPRAGTDAAVNELVRFAGPVHVESRACVNDTALGGQLIRRGQVVSMFLPAANRDPRAFASPGELLLDRSPNRHLGFGRGPHTCLGAPVAVSVAREVFATIGRRYPHARLLGEPVPRPNVTEHGFYEFKVSFSAEDRPTGRSPQEEGEVAHR